MVRVSEERGLAPPAPSSLSDSLESGPLSDRGGGLESDSGLEQSGDELEPSAARRSHPEEDHEPDYDDDIDLDQEIPGLNSEEEDEDEDDNEPLDDKEDDNEGKEKREEKRQEGDQSGGGSLQRPSRIPGGLLLRRRSDDEGDDEVDSARLEDEMSEPEAGLNEDEPANSDDEPLGKESTKDAITQMLSRLAVEGGGPDYQVPARRDMTIR